MPIRCVCFGSYLTRGKEHGVEWTQADHAMNKFVKAVKTGDCNGYSSIPILGKSRKLESKTALSAVDWFGEWAASRIPVLGIRVSPVVFVPVPGSSTCLESEELSTSARMAQAIVQHHPRVVVADVLRFRMPLKPAHEGGTRNPWALARNLVILSEATGWKGREVVLIDDVLTSGAHLRACAHVLLKHGIRCSNALLLARRTAEQVENALAEVEEEVEDLESVPGHDGSW